MKIKDIKEIVKKMVNQDYAQTLWGPRTTGSTSVIGLEDFPDEIVLEEIEGDIPECQYYKAEILGLGGKLGAVSLKSVALEEVRVREGIHGLELYCPVNINHKTNIVTFIMGIDEGQEALFTWHPGRSIPSCNLTPEMAVKVV